MFLCTAYENAYENYINCDRSAVWLAEWSDRRLFVCDIHRDYARQSHDEDHTYDQTGIFWYSDSGYSEFERRSGR